MKTQVLISAAGKMKALFATALAATLLTGCTTSELFAPPNWTPQQQAAALQLSGQLLAPPPMPEMTRCTTMPLSNSLVTNCSTM